MLDSSVAPFVDHFYWKNYYCNKSKNEKKVNANCKNRIERIQLRICKQISKQLKSPNF
jgi:hypothetical protein